MCRLVLNRYSEPEMALLSIVIPVSGGYCCAASAFRHLKTGKFMSRPDLSDSGH